MTMPLSVKHCTLVLLLDPQEDRILLGLKKKGFGSGKYNGFGGKIEPDETIIDCARREVKEECGLDILDPTYCGHLLFEFEGVSEELHVHVFRSHKYEGEIKESEEMEPKWFRLSEIPFSQMWADDSIWFPLFLAGKVFQGKFIFRGHDVIVSHTLIEVEKPPFEQDMILITGKQQGNFLAAEVA